MKKQRAVAFASIVLVLLLAGVYLWGPSAVPAGQAPLLALSNANFGAFEDAFDGGSVNSPQLVMLLSPT